MMYSYISHTHTLTNIHKLTNKLLAYEHKRWFWSLQAHYYRKHIHYRRWKFTVPTQR